MTLEGRNIHKSKVFKAEHEFNVNNKTIFYGEVIIVDDENEGGRIKVKILGLDNDTFDENLPDCYPLLPKFFHIYPKVGEMVRVFIQDMKYPNRGRFWMGSIISQLQKIDFDSFYTALSTTNMALTRPEPAISTYPDAKGVFPEKEDIAIIGRVNTDIILRVNELELRAGKHEDDNILKLNKKNPASVKLTFEPSIDTGDYYSGTVIMSDKIALISHDGIPKFKAAGITAEDRDEIFKNGHPIARGDVLVYALNIIRDALVRHIHGYSGLPADKTKIILDLENLDFQTILQENIVVN